MRKIVYGHAAYEKVDGFVIIPPGTSITFYGPPGALLDQEVSSALFNHEEVKAEDLELIKASVYFMNHGLPFPPHLSSRESIGLWPRTFKAGDRIPNFYLNPAEPPKKQILAINKVPSELITVNHTVLLEELLKNLQGCDLHWAACSFSKNPDDEAIGYGYAVKLAKISKLEPLYSKHKLTEEEKKLARLKKFGTSSNHTSARSESPSFSRENSYTVRFHPYRSRPSQIIAQNSFRSQEFKKP